MVNPQIIEYIRNQLQAGESQDKIRTDLLANGWTNSDIDEAIVIIIPPSLQIKQSTPSITPISEQMPQAMPIKEHVLPTSSIIKQNQSVSFTNSDIQPSMPIKEQVQQEQFTTQQNTQTMPVYTNAQSTMPMNGQMKQNIVVKKSNNWIIFLMLFALFLLSAVGLFAYMTFENKVKREITEVELIDTTGVNDEIKPALDEIDENTVSVGISTSTATTTTEMLDN